MRHNVNGVIWYRMSCYERTGMLPGKFTGKLTWRQRVSLFFIRYARLNDCFFVFRCPEHGLVQDLERGWRMDLRCPLCK